MTMISSRFAPVVVLAAGALLISGLREQYATPSKQPMAALALDIPGTTWRAKTVSKEEQQVAGMSDYVMRDYLKDSAAVFSVYVGYYDRQIQGKTIHSPKNCLPGAGWEVLESSQASFPSAVANGRYNRVLLANKKARALVYYWYQGRGRTESSEYRVKWNLLRDAALFGRTEEALIRVVVPVADGSNRDALAAVQIADSTALQVIAGLPPAARILLPDAP